MAGRVVSSHPGQSDDGGAEPRGRTLRSDTDREVRRGRVTEGVAGRSGRRAVRSAASEVAAKSTRLTKDDRTESEDFVDARRMESRKSVSERLDSPDFGGPGLFARPKVVNFPERLAERRQAYRRRNIIRAAIALLIVVLVSLLTWALLFSPLLRLQASQITISGTNTWVSENQVFDIAHEQAGKSLILVDTSTIETDIGDLPGVTSAEATKRYPHGLSVTVKAEVPAAVLKSDGGSLTAVDREGRVLNAVNASVKGIPVINVKNAEKSLDNKAVQQALKILGTLDESMRRKIVKVEAKTQDSVTTKLSDGYTIIWGNSSDIALKKAVVDKLLENPKQLDGAKTINVAAPDKATIK
ncbi:cell division protein [Bifidobacterium primatium]|uniref:Cell division protein n=1 Tax=Bifidobacterium primatium TaxID=2045438 RepID=A0A2M9H9Z0_9BIFI|nr:FtsQ-type POTRA domain-containing protein [Bifidobacterium primatium]PJM73623.1 cell division protein [Bifidobacterium primatium]